MEIWKSKLAAQGTVSGPVEGQDEDEEVAETVLLQLGGEMEEQGFDFDALIAEAAPKADENEDFQPAQWPPLTGWVEGEVTTKATKRSRNYEPSWPGQNREPSYNFKSSGRQYDGGKAMRGWMKQHGVQPSQDLKAHARSFDFNKLETQAIRVRVRVWVRSGFGLGLGI